MAGNDTQAFKYKQWLLSQPGKRGIDIPADTWDKIHQVASGITQPLWGRPPTPQQMQHLHDSGATTPDRIHAAFAELPHPHAPHLSVGEYDSWKSAYGLYQQHK
jgi:hypothetical protein